MVDCYVCVIVHRGIQLKDVPLRIRICVSYPLLRYNNTTDMLPIRVDTKQAHSCCYCMCDYMYHTELPAQSVLQYTKFRHVIYKIIQGYFDTTNRFPALLTYIMIRVA